jgi:hypothetical protein
MKTSLLAVVCLCLASLTFSGCQHTAPAAGSGEITGPKLETKSVVYVAIPPDGFFKKEIALDSGRATAELLRETFSHYVRQAYIGRRVETFQEALETARTFKCTYVVYPGVIVWEDHATEFSGIRDKVEVKIEVADTTSGEILHSKVIKGTGPWMTSGGNTPRDILPEPVLKFVATLFQVIHTPSALPR